MPGTAPKPGQQPSPAQSEAERPAGAEQTYDLIIAGGTIVDGTGAPKRQADMGIRGDRIAAVGDLGGARAVRRIDATGLVVAPGFIDPHNHTWDTLPEYPTDPDATSMVMQGVTTVVGGVDGRSTWPIADGLAAIQRKGTGVNYLTLAGQGTIRTRVLGYADRRPTAAELLRMEELTRQAMEEGAFGLSSGLEYTPGKFAATDEMVALAKVAASFGGIYASHVRDERSDVVRGVEEALTVGREAGLPVELSHLKLGYTAQWSSMDRLMGMIQGARARGQKVLADVYPYLAPDYATDLCLADVCRSLPPDDLILRRTADSSLLDRSLAQVAEARGVTPAVAAQQLLAVAPDTRVAADVAREDEMVRLIQADFGLVGTDGEAQPWYDDPDRVLRLVHPRSYGTYPQLLRYVRERQILSLEQMVRKMSGAVADMLGLLDRGYRRPGYFADIAVLDPAHVADRATRANPQRYPVGIRWVLVNGHLTVEDGKHVTGARYGQVIRRR